MVITSVLILKTLAMVVSVALTVDFTSQLLSPEEFRQWGMWVAILGMTFVTLALTEIIPKAVGKRWFEPIANIGIRVLRVPYFLFYPINWASARLSSAIVRSIGGDNVNPGPITFDEIEYIINSHKNAAEDETPRERLLRSVVEFPDILVREVMVPRTDMVALDTEMDVNELAEVLVECGHSRLPVYADTIDDIVGVFFAKDLLKHFNETGSMKGFETNDHLRAPFFVPESKKIAVLLNEFQRQHIHMAIVVDEFGGVSGLITLEDIVEEIFGEIQDEHDAEEDELKLQPDGSVWADARVPIYDVEAYFSIDLADDEGEYESLGGFLLEQAGEVPNEGDVFEVSGLKFKVIEADTKKISSVEITQSAALAS